MSAKILLYELFNQKQPSRGVLGKKVFSKYAAKLQENIHAEKVSAAN